MKHNFSVFLGEEGLDMTFQEDFNATTKCCYCKEEARIGFVAFEGGTPEDDGDTCVCELHENDHPDSCWPHDAISVGIYFCTKCFQTTALWNQA